MKTSDFLHANQPVFKYQPGDHLLLGNLPVLVHRCEQPGSYEVESLGGQFAGFISVPEDALSRDDN